MTDEVNQNPPPSSGKNPKDVKVFAVIYPIVVLLAAYATAQDNIAHHEFSLDDLGNFLAWFVVVAPLSAAGIIMAVHSIVKRRVTGVVIFLLLICVIFLFPQSFSALIDVFSDSAPYTNLMY